MMRPKLVDMWNKMEYPLPVGTCGKIAAWMLKRDTWDKRPGVGITVLGSRKTVTVKGKMIGSFQELHMGPFSIEREIEYDDAGPPMTGKFRGYRTHYGMAVWAKDSQANEILAAMTPEERGPTLWQLDMPVLAAVIYRPTDVGNPPFILGQPEPFPQDLLIYPVPFPFVRTQQKMLNALFFLADKLDYAKYRYNAVLDEDFTHDTVFNEIFVDDLFKGAYHAVAKIDPVNDPQFNGSRAEFIGSFRIPLNQEPPPPVDLSVTDITPDEERIVELETMFESYMRHHPDAPKDYMTISIVMGLSNEYYALLEKFGQL